MSIGIYTRNEKQSQKWLQKLRSNLPGIVVEVYPDISRPADVAFLVCWKPVTGLLDEFSNLKAIQSLGAGVDHILDHHNVPPHIQVSKVVDDNLTHDMWEHALTMIMADMKNLDIYATNQSNKMWNPKRYKRIKDVSVGILGLGTIGKYVASQFVSVGYDVSGWSRSEKDIAGVDTFTGEAGLSSVLAISDYVINILPLTPSTTGLIDKEFLSMMKEGSYLINIGRGAQVVDQDLIWSIENGPLRGAALDVFHNEPLPEENLFWNHTSIRITPHVASLTHIDSVYHQVVENYKLLISGKSINNRIDLKKGY